MTDTESAEGGQGLAMFHTSGYENKEFINILNIVIKLSSFLYNSDPHLFKNLELSLCMYFSTFGNVQTKYADIAGIFTMLNVPYIVNILAKLRILQQNKNDWDVEWKCQG